MWALGVGRPVGGAGRGHLAASASLPRRKVLLSLLESFGVRIAVDKRN